MQNKITLKKIIFFVALIAALVGGYFLWMKFKSHPADANPKIIDVTIVTIAKQTVQLFQELPARVEAYKSSDVRPQAEGIIRKINFTQGSFVQKDQQLYQIDSRMYQNAYEGAKLNFQAQAAKRERYRILLTQDAVSKQEFDDVNASAALAEADFTKAETALAYTKVYAPISGYIGKTNFTEGTLVTVNQIEPLTTIIQLDPLYVDMVQPSKDAIKLQNQKEIPVTLITENNSYQEAGTLKFTEVFADESTDSVRLRAIFPNVDKKLMPGMFVTAKLHLSPFEAITVPQRVTSRGADGGLSVWIVDKKDNTAKQRKIKADQIAGDNWIVAEGLEEGDVVIYEGYLKITEGAKVNPLTFEQIEAAKLAAKTAANPTSKPGAPTQPAQAQPVAAAPAPYVTPIPKDIDPEIDHTVPDFILEQLKKKSEAKNSSKKKLRKKDPKKIIEKNLDEVNPAQITSAQINSAIENSATQNPVPENATSATQIDSAINTSITPIPAQLENPSLTQPAIATPIQTTPIHTTLSPITGGGK